MAAYIVLWKHQGRVVSVDIIGEKFEKGKKKRKKEERLGNLT